MPGHLLRPRADRARLSLQPARPSAATEKPKTPVMSFHPPAAVGAVYDRALLSSKIVDAGCYEKLCAVIDRAYSLASINSFTTSMTAHLAHSLAKVAVIDRDYRPMPRNLLFRGVLQHRANLGCSCRADASSPSATTTSGSSRRSRRGSGASASCSAIAAGPGQID